MSGPFEKYVAQAALALHRQRFGLDVPWGEFGPVMEEMERAEVRAALAAVGPLIAEDTRERMVAAAGAALEREGAGADGCKQAYERGRRETLKEIADEMALSQPEDPCIRYVDVRLDKDAFRQIMAARESATLPTR